MKKNPDGMHEPLDSCAIIDNICHKILCEIESVFTTAENTDIKTSMQALQIMQKILSIKQIISQKQEQAMQQAKNYKITIDDIGIILNYCRHLLGNMP